MNEISLKELAQRSYEDAQALVEVVCSNVDAAYFRHMHNTYGVKVVAEAATSAMREALNPRAELAFRNLSTAAQVVSELAAEVTSVLHITVEVIKMENGMSVNGCIIATTRGDKVEYKLDKETAKTVETFGYPGMAEHIDCETVCMKGAFWHGGVYLRLAVRPGEYGRG